MIEISNQLYVQNIHDKSLFPMTGNLGLKERIFITKRMIFKYLAKNVYFL
jgi:hypothetical protein